MSNTIIAQITAAFTALPSDEKKNMLDMLTLSARNAAKEISKASGITTQVKVGDQVTVTSSTFVAKKYWGKTFTVTKIAPTHFWLFNPEQPEKNLWPLHGDVKKVEVEAVEEEITTAPTEEPQPLMTEEEEFQALLDQEAAENEGMQQSA
jgi:hypothetical protein